MRKWSLMLIFVLSAVLVACSTTTSTAKKGAPGPTAKVQVDQHPPLSQQEKLVPCSQCHKDVTPNVYKEWYASLHGLDNVKCFQCHGTFEDFHVTPPIMKCEACHAQQVEKMKVKKACWECHPAHGFNEHK